MIQKFKKLGRTIKTIVLNPKHYFTKIVADGDIEESMLNAFMYGMLGGLAVLLIKLIGGASITFAGVFTAIIIVPVLAVALLFLIGGLLMLISEITNGERDWEIAIKGLASVFFVYPFILILNALAFNCTSLWAISMAIDAYIIFLIYNIVVYCMKGKRNSVLMVLGILVLFLITVYATDFRIGWFMIKNTGATLACLV